MVTDEKFVQEAEALFTSLNSENCTCVLAALRNIAILSESYSKRLNSADDPKSEVELRLIEKCNYWFSVLIPKAVRLCMRKTSWVLEDELRLSVVEVNQHLSRIINALIPRIKNGIAVQEEVDIISVYLSPYSGYYERLDKDKHQNLITEAKYNNFIVEEVSLENGSAVERASINEENEIDWLENIQVGEKVEAKVNNTYDIWLEATIMECSPTRTEILIEYSKHQEQNSLVQILSRSGDSVFAESKMNDATTCVHNSLASGIDSRATCWISVDSSCIKKLGSRHCALNGTAIGNKYENDGESQVDASAPEQAWRKALSIGSMCDAKDSLGFWYQAVVVDVKRVGDQTWRRESPYYPDTINGELVEDMVKVSFVGWKRKFDEWIVLRSAGRLASINERSNGRRGIGNAELVDEELLSTIVSKHQDDEYQFKDDFVVGRVLAPVSRHFLSNLNGFIAAGGLDAFVLSLETRRTPGVTLKQLKMIVCIISRISTWLVDEVFIKMCVKNNLVTLAFQILQNSTNDQIRNLSQDYVSEILYGLRCILFRGMSRMDAITIVEKFEFLLAVKRMNSRSIQQRIKGLEFVSSYIEYSYRSVCFPSGMIVAKQSSSSNTGSNIFMSVESYNSHRMKNPKFDPDTSVEFNNISDDETIWKYMRIKIAHWMAPKELCEWVLDNGIFKQLLERPHTHPELVSRSYRLVQLLSCFGRLTKAHIRKMVEFIQNEKEDNRLSKSFLSVLVSTIKRNAFKNDYCIGCCRCSHLYNSSKGITHNSKYQYSVSDLDSTLVSILGSFCFGSYTIGTLNVLAEIGIKTDAASEAAVALLWSIAQCSNITNTGVLQEACSSLARIFNSLGMKEINNAALLREKYLKLSIESVSVPSSVLSCVLVMKTIILSYGSNKTQSQQKPSHRSSILHRLCVSNNLSDILVSSLLNLKSTYAKAKSNHPDPSSYWTQLSSVLDFFFFFLNELATHNPGLIEKGLREHHVDKIYSCLCCNAFDQSEMDICFNWLINILLPSISVKEQGWEPVFGRNNDDEDYHLKNVIESSIIQDRLICYIFKEKLCSSLGNVGVEMSKLDNRITLLGFRCYQSYFYRVNIIHDKIKVISDASKSESEGARDFQKKQRNVEVIDPNLIGYEDLWGLAFGSIENNVADAAVSMLSMLQSRFSKFENSPSDVSTLSKKIVVACDCHLKKLLVQLQHDGDCVKSRLYHDSVTPFEFFESIFTRISRCIALIHTLIADSEEEMATFLELYGDKFWSLIRPHHAIIYNRQINIVASYSNDDDGTKQRLDFYVRVNEPVWKVKRMIATRLGIEPDNLKYWINGKEITVSQNCVMLTKYFDATAVNLDVTVIFYNNDHDDAQGTLKSRCSSSDAVVWFDMLAASMIRSIIDYNLFFDLMNQCERISEAYARRAAKAEPVARSKHAKVSNFAGKVVFKLERLLEILPTCPCLLNELQSIGKSAVIRIRASSLGSYKLIYILHIIEGELQHASDLTTKPKPTFEIRDSLSGGDESKSNFRYQNQNQNWVTQFLKHQGLEVLREKLRSSVVSLGKTGNCIYENQATGFFFQRLFNSWGVLMKVMYSFLAMDYLVYSKEEMFTSALDTIFGASHHVTGNGMSENPHFEAIQDFAIQNDPIISLKELQELIGMLEKWLEHCLLMNKFIEEKGDVGQKGFDDNHHDFLIPLRKTTSLSVNLWTMSCIAMGKSISVSDSFLDTLIRYGLCFGAANNSFLKLTISRNIMVLCNPKTFSWDIRRKMISALLNQEPLVAPPTGICKKSTVQGPYDDYFSLLTNLVISEIQQLKEKNTKMISEQVASIVNRFIAAFARNEHVTFDAIFSGKCFLLQSIIVHSGGFLQTLRHDNEGRTDIVVVFNNVLNLCLHRVDHNIQGSLKRQIFKFLLCVISGLLEFPVQSNAPENKIQCLLMQNMGETIQVEDVRLTKDNWNVVSNTLVKENPLLIKSSVNLWDVKLQRAFSPTTAKGFVGIKNLGCTCYMNSLLQQLFMRRRIRYGILFAITDESPDVDVSLVDEVKIIFATLDAGVRDAYSPAGFCETFKDNAGNPVNVKEQHDAHEFFTTLCDRIDGILEDSNRKRLFECALGVTTSSQLVCLEKQLKATKENESVTEYCLTQDIANAATLTESLSEYVEGEILNDYRWEEFGNRPLRTLKRQYVKHLSDILTIHLKRFRLNWDTMRTEKVNKRFEFPLELDMFPYTKEGLDWKIKCLPK